MIYSYVRYELERSSAIPSGVIYRPEILVRVFGPERSFQILGLLDTGADHVFMSSSLAKVLKIDTNSVGEKAISAGGQEVDVRPGSVEIEIAQGHESYRWRTEVGFLHGDDVPPIAYLGHVGFLEHFKASFDFAEQTIELIPKASFG